MFTERVFGGLKPTLRAVLAGFAVALFAGAAVAQVGIKPPLVGLIAMGQDGFSAANTNARYLGIPGNSLGDLIARRNAFDGVVINVAWAELEPSPGGALNWAPIERALADIRAYNTDPATRVRLRAILRIWAGGVAPAWAKSLDGPPIDASTGNAMHHHAYVLGRFWSDAYMRAWRDLQSRLAARYDAEPLIVQVSNTSCTSDTDEPGALARFQSRAEGISTIRALHEAGFTDAAYDRCLRESVQDYAGWRATYVNFTLNPLFRLDGIADFGRPGRDTDSAAQLIAEWRAAFGSRLVIANHNLNYPLPPHNADLYAIIRAQGGQIEFQTHSPANLDWANTVKEAVCLGAHSLEIWNNTNAGGFVDYPVSTLMAWSEELKHTSSNALCPG